MIEQNAEEVVAVLETELMEEMELEQNVQEIETVLR